MTIDEIINRQREIYLRQLNEFYLNRNDGAKELLVQYPSENNGLFLNLTRMDYIKKNGEDWVIEEFSPDSYINHEPILFTHDELSIEINPFFWHGCEIIVEPAFDSFTILENWTKEWIDEDEIIEIGEDGLSRAIHSVSIPETTDNNFSFCIDLGTCSKECLFDLFKILKNYGAKKIIINSFSLFE